MSSPGRRTRAEKGNRFPFLRQIFTSRLTRPLRKAGKCAAVHSLFACTHFAYERAWARSLFVLYTGIVLVFYGGRQNSGLVFRPSMLYRARVRSVGRKCAGLRSGVMVAEMRAACFPGFARQASPLKGTYEKSSGAHGGGGGRRTPVYGVCAEISHNRG